MHGICGVKTHESTGLQNVAVIDGNWFVRLTKSGIFDAALNPTQARFLAKLLRESADRVEALGSSKIKP